MEYNVKLHMWLALCFSCCLRRRDRAIECIFEKGDLGVFEAKHKRVNREEVVGEAGRKNQARKPRKIASDHVGGMEGRGSHLNPPPCSPHSSLLKNGEEDHTVIILPHRVVLGLNEMIDEDQLCRG